MEHIIITPIDEEFVRLTPEAGYTLWNKIQNRQVSEAVVKPENIKNFVARPIPVPDESVVEAPAPKKSNRKKSS